MVLIDALRGLPGRLDRALGRARAQVAWRLRAQMSDLYKRKAGGAARPVLFDVEAAYPALLVLERNTAVIQAEVDALLRARARIPSYAELDPIQGYIAAESPAGSQWRVLMLESYGERIAENAACAPRTAALLREVPNVTQAFFSILEPRKSVPPHEGPNGNCLRYHLGLRVPAKDPPRIRVHDRFFAWREGGSFLFDDTWEHEVVNDCDEPRVVLIVDVLRPMPPAWHALNWLYVFVGARVVYARGVILRNLARARRRGG